MTRKLLLAAGGGLLLLAAAQSAQAQRIGWEAALKTRFDNREYTGSSCNDSQTIFLADFSTAVTYHWMERNTLRLGVELQKDFGDNRDFVSDTRLLLSYAYRAERAAADVGIFSRDELRGHYSDAFFNDSLRVYSPTVQGMAIRYLRHGLLAEAVIDWEGMYSETSREKFRIFGNVEKSWWGGSYRPGWYAGAALSMFHFANSALTQGNVVDNMLANPYVGFGRRAGHVVSHSPLRPGRYALREVFWYDFRLGMLWAPQRDRETDAGWEAPMGGELRIALGWRGLRFENNTYAGENLMPFFDKYGPELYAGERWYATPHKIYNRTLLGYDRDFFRGTLHVKAGMVFHYDGKGMYTQQILQVGVRLGEVLYDRKNHRGR